MGTNDTKHRDMVGGYGRKCASENVYLSGNDQGNFSRLDQNHDVVNAILLLFYASP